MPNCAAPIPLVEIRVVLAALSEEFAFGGMAGESEGSGAIVVSDGVEGVATVDGSEFPQPATSKTSPKRNKDGAKLERTILFKVERRFIVIIAKIEQEAKIKGKMAQIEQIEQSRLNRIKLNKANLLE
jgi:hypothetical protein